MRLLLVGLLLLLVGVGIGQLRSVVALSDIGVVKHHAHGAIVNGLLSLTVGEPDVADTLECLRTGVRPPEQSVLWTCWSGGQAKADLRPITCAAV